jgi:hypothetical protein
MYENDPNRPRVGDPVRAGDGSGYLIGGLAIAAVVALALFLWPRDATGPSMTQNTGIERPSTPTTPTTPPANRPATPSGPATTPPK